MKIFKGFWFGFLAIGCVQFLTAQCGGSGSGEDCDIQELCGINAHPGIGCPEYWDCLMMCPLIIDVERDGFHFGGSGSTVFFDLLGDGVPDHLQWVLSGEDDAFLFMDLNQNGIVDDGSELFGSGTRLILEGDALALNGFLALAQFDLPGLGGNDNGQIDHEDDIWSVLNLWTDLNADAVSTPNEVRHIEIIGLSRLGIIPRTNGRIDEHGNGLRFWAWARGPASEGIRKHKMVDVYFKKGTFGLP